MPVERRSERERARRASEARRLLDEPLLSEALERSERAAIEEMLRLPFWADRKRRMLTDRIRVIRDMRAHLVHVIVDFDHTQRPELKLA